MHRINAYYYNVDDFILLPLRSISFRSICMVFFFNRPRILRWSRENTNKIIVRDWVERFEQVFSDNLAKIYQNVCAAAVTVWTVEAIKTSVVSRYLHTPHEQNPPHPRFNIKQENGAILFFPTPFEASNLKFANVIRSAAELFALKIWICFCNQSSIWSTVEAQQFGSKSWANNPFLISFWGFFSICRKLCFAVKSTQFIPIKYLQICP